MKAWKALRLCLAEIAIRVLIKAMPRAARNIWLNHFAVASQRCARLYENENEA
jgi:hypothetical protein